MDSCEIFIINRDQDTVRRSNISSLCKSYNMKFSFVKAVDGSDINKDLVSGFDVSKSSLYGQLSPTELACALSHIKIYNHIIKSKLTHAVIMEDDITFDDNLPFLIKNVIKLPSDLELLLLGYYSDTKTQRISNSSLWYVSDSLENFKVVRLTELAFGTHGYLITNRGANKLLSELNTIYQPIDHYTGQCVYINMYAIKPRIVDLHPIDSKKSSVEKFKKNVKFITKKNKIIIFLKKNMLICFLLKKLNIIYQRFKYIKKFNKL